MQPDGQERRSPRMAGSGHSNRLGGRIDYAALAGQRPSAQSDDPFELILSHAEGVKRLGRDRAIFKAGTRSDRTASVSLARGADGAVLLHDFGGDSAADILAAIGLSLASLFPARERRDMTPAERSELRTHAKFAGWSAALGVLDREATVVLIASGFVQRGERLAADDQTRLAEACSRIHDAREVLR